jgi:hypothetical protein
MSGPITDLTPRQFDDDEVMDWGIVIDALVEHRASAERRKAANSESTSDTRADACARMIAAIVADADAAYHRSRARRAAGETAMTAENKPVRFCDWWLASRRKCMSRGSIHAEDQFGAPLFFCYRHWPLAEAGRMHHYGPVRKVADPA